MTQITSKTSWTIELSDEEYRIVTESLKRTAKTPEQKSLYRAFVGQIPTGSNLTEDDFVIGDRVILLDDLDSIADEDGTQDFCGGDVCSIIDVNSSHILVLNLTRPGTHSQGHWLPAKYFSFDGPMISIDQVKDQLRDQLSVNDMSMTDFAKLLKTFSK
jgi:hypothetical protein